MQLVEVETATLVSLRFGRYYPPSSQSCARARRDVVTAFAELGASDDGAFAGSVMISELFTNAILHHVIGSCEQVHVGIYESTEASGRWFGLAVTDAGSGTAQTARDVAPDRHGFGRGLEVVRGMGARLTDVRVPGGYTVTAWFPASDQLREHVCQCDCPSANHAHPSICSWIVASREAPEVLPDDIPALRLCSACCRQQEETDTPVSDGNDKRKTLEDQAGSMRLGMVSTADADAVARTCAVTSAAAVR